MKTFDIKIKEYGIKIAKTIRPLHYKWDYCVENKIPYIIVCPKIKYSEIEYDLMTIDDGISFEKKISFQIF